MLWDGVNPFVELRVKFGDDAPYTLDYPSYIETDQTVVLPPSDPMSAAAARAMDVDKTLSGVAYRRAATVQGGVLRVVASQRVLVPEISAKEARADSPALKTLGEQGVYAPAGQGRLEA